VQKGCTYHGLALNVNLELTPFTYINPCGYQDLKMVKVQDFAPKITMAMIAAQLIPIMLEQLEA
jgi:lipoyl(octanoyl) transferase